MIYMHGDVSIVILDSANLELLRKGKAAQTPDGKIVICHCPDLQRMANGLAFYAAQKNKIIELIDGCHEWEERSAT